MLNHSLGIVRRMVPKPVFNALNPVYHYLMALAAAAWYGFPARQIKVIAVTGTKGKSSTTEILNAILEEAGYITAVSNTIRFKVADATWPNKYKMSMPGRFALQKLIRRAVRAGCHYVIMEMTSQGALLYRHRFIELDMLIFTNLTPEHIEAHGSYDNYLNAKLAIARNMTRSSKRPRIIVANIDDKEGEKFLACECDEQVPYSIHDVEPYKIKPEGLELNIGGMRVHSPLSGLFNLYNLTAAITAARTQNVHENDISKAVSRIASIPGRVERIEAGQAFTVVVDYAHTPDSLRQFYEVFGSTRKICVLGGTGGGRDSWKRAEMGAIADKHCQEIILTDEDPYDEDPRQIVEDVAKGITVHQPSIIMDRRQAIREALKRARPGDAVLITGKGTDPYIMGPRNTRVPWSDSGIAREELAGIVALEPK
ncbi:MAG: UDP-N-acetylmuramyl-tripeptide synthetase [Patescibacteria group bacterium]|nr:UDP-N-acetylmuramyl-tripeptide synthetase [Patescibacteria group bacterium]MDE2172439.1 UDP-N-acetylmuramyl-tripeptide synthetase [Patescibacteria group bacterium]